MSADAAERQGREIACDRRPFPSARPGRTVGEVLVFVGPLDGPLTRSEAWWIVQGEQVGDSFGFAVVAVDATADGRSDLLVGARTAEDGLGTVYLLETPDL